MEIYSKFKHSHWRKCIRKCHLQNGYHFVRPWCIHLRKTAVWVLTNDRHDTTADRLSQARVGQCNGRQVSHRERNAENCHGAKIINNFNSTDHTKMSNQMQFLKVGVDKIASTWNWKQNNRNFHLKVLNVNIHIHQHFSLLENSHKMSKCFNFLFKYQLSSSHFNCCMRQNFDQTWDIYNTSVKIR